MLLNMYSYSHETFLIKVAQIKNIAKIVFMYFRPNYKR